MARPDFWNNQESAQATVAALKRVRAIIDPVEELRKRSEDIEAMLEMLADEEDASILDELSHGVTEFAKIVDRLEMLALLSGPHDTRDCYFNIQAGTGGADACDWAEMLFRMYLRFFERNGFTAEQLSRRDGEEAGIQSCSLLVKGQHAYGYLSCEMGVHRLVRISPFSAQGKRETSFASVDVQPDIGDIEIDVDWDKEVREDTYRASGAGGQHVNKTDSAVRLTHLATGAVAQCQNERSQHKNRASAKKMLVARLFQFEQAKRDAELSKFYSEKGQISWGNSIRSYFLYPEQRVKDARNGYVTHDSTGVLDGDIQAFIDAELRRRATRQHTAADS